MTQPLDTEQLRMCYTVFNGAICGLRERHRGKLCESSDNESEQPPSFPGDMQINFLPLVGVSGTRRTHPLSLVYF